MHGAVTPDLAQHLTRETHFRPVTTHPRGGCDRWHNQWEERENQKTGTIVRFIKLHSLTYFGIAMHKKKRIYFFKGVTLWPQTEQICDHADGYAAGDTRRGVECQRVRTDLLTPRHRDPSSLYFVMDPQRSAQNKTFAKVLTVDKPISQIILNQRGAKSRV